MEYEDMGHMSARNGIVPDLGQQHLMDNDRKADMGIGLGIGEEIENRINRSFAAIKRLNTSLPLLTATSVTYVVKYVFATFNTGFFVTTYGLAFVFAALIGLTIGIKRDFEGIHEFIIAKATKK
jgi:hypothetical protein